MKNCLFLMVGLLFLSDITKAQIILGAKFGPNATITKVKDNDGSFDGFTELEKNQNGFGASLTFDFPATDQFYFGTGIGFVQKNMSIRNSIGGYSGTSRYNVAYFQVPVLAKYRTGEVFTKKLNLVFGAGPVFDFKIGETVKGGDGAHYMHMADNNSNADPSRGYNGSGKAIPLFAPINIGLLINAGAEYQLLDQLAVTAGFTVNPSFMNMINPKLTFPDFVETPLKDDLIIKTNTISFDLGIKFVPGK